jgi:hypothetical protein
MSSFFGPGVEMEGFGPVPDCDALAMYLIKVCIVTMVLLLYCYYHYYMVLLLYYCYYGIIIVLLLSSLLSLLSFFIIIIIIIIIVYCFIVFQFVYRRGTLTVTPSLCIS